jgi:hypothetical protein
MIDFNTPVWGVGERPWPSDALPGKCSSPRGGPQALIWETTLQSQDPRGYRREGCSNAYGRSR